MAEIQANGVRFHVQTLGSLDNACPVVFLHGLMIDNLASWYFTCANHVARAVPVILYDLRGHGNSERPATGYSVSDMVKDLDGILEALGVRGKVSLVGNSFGGLIGLAFAAKHPERVSNVVLVDAHLGGEGWAETMAASLELTGEERDRRIEERFREWPGRNSRRKTARAMRGARALVNATSLITDLRASAPLSADELRAITCPVFGIYGEHSDLLACAQQVKESLAHYELRTVAGATHSVLWEATQVVCEQIQRWLLDDRAQHGAADARS